MGNMRMELKGRLDGRQRNRLKRLLNMLYTPKELAEEIGITKSQVYRVYIPQGCPHERDSRRHIWINGKEFSQWYQQAYPKVRLKSDEAFCLTCKMAVKIMDPVRQAKNGLIFDECHCPHCGRKLARIVDRDS